MLGKATTVLVAVLLICVLALAQGADATHVRPKGATPLKVSLVVAQRECAGSNANTSHAQPFGLPSCAPPAQTSNYVTAGTPDANGAAANLNGYVRLTAATGAGDVLVDSNVQDVRCLPASGVCPHPNSADGPDYAGGLQVQLTVRVTDHYSNPGPTTPATAWDFLFGIPVGCVPTPTTTTIGSTCSVSSSLNAIIPGFTASGRRSVFQLPQRAGGVQVVDGGPNGISGDPNATLFLEPGVFLP